MSKRQEKKERRSYHDSRRYLKKHPPKRSDPLVGMAGEEIWSREVKRTIRNYPKWQRDREDALRYGAFRTGRRGLSAEETYFRYGGGSVEAVETALLMFSREERRELKDALWGSQPQAAGRGLVNRFRRYLAVFLGYGRPGYNMKKG